MPVRFFEGIREDERNDLQRRNLERRFYALAAAVKNHEAALSRNHPAVTREDENLYRRLRQLVGDPATSEHTVA